MLKKILIITILVGFAGLLVWGGVNRTLARTGESSANSAENNGRGAGNRSAESHVSSNGEDCEESHEMIQSQDGTGRRGNHDDAQTQSNGEPAGNWGQSNELNGAQGGNGGGNGSGGGNGRGQGGGYEPLDQAEIEALNLALDDEYHALAVYESVIADFGEVTPFVEIAQSESRHIEALLNHFDKHGLTPPENPWLGKVPSFESLQAACQAGVEAEMANAALYDQLFSMTDDPGLIQVFTNLSRASQESHLPEFQSCQ